MQPRWYPRRGFALSILTAVLWATTVTAAGQQQSALESELWEGNVHLGKVSSDLLKVRRARQHGMPARDVQRAAPGVPFRNQQPDVEVRLRVLTPEIVARVKAIGMQIAGVYSQSARLYGRCDPDLLDQIAAIPEVTGIYPNYPPIQHAGAVTSQADVSIHAAQARATFGVDGSGVQVGVLSDSFNSVIGGSVSGAGCSRTLTGATSQLSGDLPDSVTLLESGPGGVDEGAAMAELIHDLAPGAAIMFHTAAGGEAAFAAGIDQLRSCGADVIVDDFLYQLGPMFQDGLVAQAAQRAVDDGIAYFSAAGNFGRIGVSAPYHDADPNTDDQAAFPSGADLHRFGSGSVFAAITFPPFCAMQLVLQWSEPFSGVLGPGASSDLDFYVFDAPNVAAAVVDASTMSQGCRRPGGGTQGDPIEAVFVSNTAHLRQPPISPSNTCAAIRMCTCASPRSRWDARRSPSTPTQPRSTKHRSMVRRRPQAWPQWRPSHTLRSTAAGTFFRPMARSTLSP